MAIPYHKIMLFGDSGVGKTTTIRNILGEPAPPSLRDLELVHVQHMEDFDKDIHECLSATTADGHIPTLGVDVNPIRLATDQGEVVVNIWEVAGDPRYAGEGSAYHTRSEGAIIMRESEMDTVERWSNVCSIYKIQEVRIVNRDSNFPQVLGELLGDIRSQQMGRVEVLPS